MQQVFEQCIVKNQKHDTKYKVLLLFEKKDLFAAFIRKVLEKVNNNNNKNSRYTSHAYPSMPFE